MLTSCRQGVVDDPRRSNKKMNGRPQSDVTPFWDETARGIANVIGKTGETWYGKDSSLYERERANLEHYLSPMYYGLGATVFLFINFRITGSQRFVRWRQSFSQGHVQKQSSHRKNVGSSTTEPSSSTSTSTSPATNFGSVGYLDRKRKADVENALASMRVMTDLLVSTSVGVSGTLFMLEGKKGTMRQDFETAPLVRGRSAVAEEMCPGMMKIASENSITTTQNIADDKNLTTFLNFVKNCREREARVEVNAPITP